MSPFASKPTLPIGESKFAVAAMFLSTSARVGILPPLSLIAFSIAAISIFAAVYALAEYGPTSLLKRALYASTNVLADGSFAASGAAVVM